MRGFAGLRMTRRMLGHMVLGAVLALGTATGAMAQEFTMRFSTPTINDPQHRWMQYFQQHVQERTGGRLAVEIYPASQLGPVASVLEGVQLGTIEANISPFEFYAGIDPLFQLPATPGLFRSMEHARERLDDPAVREALFSIGIPRGVRGIGALINAPAIYASRFPINSLADFSGRRIRVLASFTEIGTTNALGASGVPMPLNEVPAALQQGAIDGAASTIYVFLTLRIHQSAPHLVPTELWHISSLISVSEIWFEGLPPDIQQAIIDVAAEADTHMFGEVMAGLANNVQLWREAGGSYTPLPEADQARAVELALGVAEQFLDQNPRFRELFNIIAGN
jgi:TRAP-type transport system periplasmic protein